MNFLEQKHCEICQEKIFGRSDKRFCSDHCRNAYHNRRNLSSNRIIKSTHRRLQKNRRILEEFLKLGRSETSKDSLLEEGFSFQHHTGSLRDSSGFYYFCYDYMFQFLPKNRVLLAERKIE